MKKYKVLSPALFTKFLCLAALVMSVFSCVPRKSYVLMQNHTKPAPDTVELNVIKDKYLVRPGDILYIMVLSPDQEAVQVFNMESINQNKGAGPSTGIMNSGYVIGYTISEEGTIRLPMLGKVNVQGRALPEIDELLTEKLSYYLKDVIVKVRLISFKVTVLGEVRTPGVQSVQAERYTILEALGNANDLTDFADRKHIELMRATPNGYVVYNIDLTDQNIVKSKSFFLAPNDVLYVRPMPAKMVRINYPIYSYIIGGLSTIVIMWSLLSR